MLANSTRVDSTALPQRHRRGICIKTPRLYRNLRGAIECQLSRNEYARYHFLTSVPAFTVEP